MRSPRASLVPSSTKLTVLKCGQESEMRRRRPKTRYGPVTASWHWRTQRQRSGLKVIDLGAGHSSGSETLCGRVITALKSGALLNESVGAGYIDRHWPPAFKDAGAWPLTSLRQSFLNGALTRLIDPDTVLRQRIIEFVGAGDFGLASGDLERRRDTQRLWFRRAGRSGRCGLRAWDVPVDQGQGWTTANGPRRSDADSYRDCGCFK